MFGVISALDQGVGGKREKKPETVEQEIDELGGVAPA
jgi:hypothetical protein